MEALDCLGDAYVLLGFIDDNLEKVGTQRFGWPVLTRSALKEFPDARVLAVPGSPTSYRQRADAIAGLGIESQRFATVIHPDACVSPRAQIGFNVLIMAGAVINSSAVVGNHVCVLPNSVVHHDAVVSDWSLIGANVTIAGGASVGENAYIGSGSSVMNGVHIGAGALVGMGSNVIRAVAPGATVAGNPARQLRA